MGTLGLRKGASVRTENTCVIDQNIDLGIPLHDRRNHLIHSFFVCHIAGIDRHGLSETFQLFLGSQQTCLVDIYQDNIRTAGAEDPAAFKTDALCRTGDQRNASTKFHKYPPLVQYRMGDLFKLTQREQAMLGKGLFLDLCHHFQLLFFVVARHSQLIQVDLHSGNATHLTDDDLGILI